MPASPAVRATTLAWADFRSLARNPFLLGVAVALTGLLAPLVAFAPYGPSEMRDLLLFTGLVSQLVVAIVVATRVASARRTRFVESLYTTPLQARTWLASQALFGLFLCGLLLVVHLPAVAVYTAFVGPPHMLLPVLGAAVGTAFFSVALGLFLGVVVGQAGPGAAAGLAGGIAFASFFAFIVHGITADVGPMSAKEEWIVRITSLSPLALAADAAGIDIFGLGVEDRWRPILGLTVYTLGLGAAAALAYLRLQSPTGWEPRPGRLLLTALVAAAVVVPVVTAEVSFQPVEPRHEFVLDHGDLTRIAFVSAGTPITDGLFTLRGSLSWDHLTHGEDNRLDALVMLIIPPDATVRGVSVQVIGADAFAVVDGGTLSVPSGQPAGQARMGDFLSSDSEGALRPVYRVPVTVRPQEAESILGSPGIMEVHTRFQADGRAQESHARVTLQSDVPGAPWAMLAAGLPAPSAALALLVTRRIRTR